MSASARENILKKIRMALEHPTPLPFPESNATEPVVQPLQQDIVVEFAEQFTQLGGKFSFCENMQELAVQLNHLFDQREWKNVYCTETVWKNLLQHDAFSDDIVNCDAAITSCETLIARTGSVVVSARNSGRIPSVYTPVHICIAKASQLVYDIKDALLQLEKYGDNLPSQISLATGPSRTADIEKTLVVGVHGPKEVYCFIVED
ncbi:MAG: LUD domain-containing protein [Flavisolibacter sp.]|nr:LUD domain-containing protein [Flavisolibacter sp.]MBD0296900.1 LUD domain-containing protein [Flavisolibacter sp.]MBD0366549.1 LUD domain-containing protein [Flavisolibacter sp.]